MGFWIGGVGGGGEDVGGTEVWTKLLGDDGPAHEFWDCEELEEASFGGDEGVACVGVDTVEKV